MPALPLDEAGKYVAGAYLVFTSLLLVYVAIMAGRLARIQRQVGELAQRARERHDEAPGAVSSEGSGKQSIGERIAP